MGPEGLGYESIIINNNPETVSTDFDTADKLYFEPLHTDDVMNVIKQEHPEGVILQFGGQTSLNLASGWPPAASKNPGHPEQIHRPGRGPGEIRQPPGSAGYRYAEGLRCQEPEEAFERGAQLGYPLVVRPSFVIGGRGPCRWSTPRGAGQDT